MHLESNLHSTSQVPEISPVDLEKVWALDRGERVCMKPDPVHHQVFGWTMEQLGWEDIRHPL